MKCPNCNAENAEGMKFCGECGTKLPEPMNHCPTCNKDWPITMKFCGECGFKFGGGSAAGSANYQGGLQKNFGNIDNSVTSNTVNNTSNVDNSNTTVNTTNNTTNTTVINSDETAKLAKCHICGSLQKITSGYECPVCHEYTCNSCFVVARNCCKSCAEVSQKQAAEAKIAGAMEFIDKLRNDFDSLSSDDVFEYLKHHNNPASELYIETQKKLAKRYYENENWERVISVYKLAPDNIKLHDGDSLFMYGYALYEANNERLNNYDAKEIFDISDSKGNKDATVMKEIVTSNPVYVGSDSKIKYGLMKYSDNMYAQYIIGYIYEEIRHEPALAKEWYEKAANQGHKSAIRRLEPILKAEAMANEKKASAEKVIADRKAYIDSKIGAFVKSHGGYEILYKLITSGTFTKDELETYFPNRKEVLAPCNGKIHFGGVKPAFGAAQHSHEENWTRVFLDSGTKVKEGDLIGYTNLMPEVSKQDYIWSPNREVNYKFEISDEAFLIEDQGKWRDYFMYADKDDVIAIDREKNVVIKAPDDGFVKFITYSKSKPLLVTNHHICTFWKYRK